MERNLEWLNLHHLQCFWLVARRGGLAQAGAALHVTPSTVWAQVRKLEERLGRVLLEKRGRKLALTPDGERIAAIADELFALSGEILAAARGEEPVAARARVGVVSSVPRFVAARLLAPILARGQRLHIVEGSTDALLGQLAGGTLEAVLSDEARTGRVRAAASLVATSGVGLFCAPALHRALQRDFPRSLDGAPFILPTFGTAQRGVIEDELRALGVRVSVVCELDDSALTKALAAEGRAVIAAPELVRDELLDFFGLKELDALEAKVSYYLLSVRGRERFTLRDLVSRASS